MLNSDCTPGWTEPDKAHPGRHVACCGCGWDEPDFPSKTKAKAAQRAHRFPPRLPSGRCDEIGEAHQPHDWADDEFPTQQMRCNGKAVARA